MLYTRDVATLRDFFESLGFIEDLKYVHDGELNWMSMKFQGTTLMLQHDDNAAPNSSTNDVELYVVCDEVDGIYATWQRRGIAVTEPKVAFYGMKQMFVRDPDGRRICFESAVKR